AAREGETPVSLPSAAGEGETFLGDASVTGGEIATRGGTVLTTSAGAIVGTLEYMAPEQAKGRPVDHRADIYAFGLIVSDMLTGIRKAEPGISPIDQLNLRVSTPPQPLRARDETIPEPVDALVTRCLQLDPAGRFQ